MSKLDDILSTFEPDEIMKQEIKDLYAKEIDKLDKAFKADIKRTLDRRFGVTGSYSWRNILTTYNEKRKKLDSL